MNLFMNKYKILKQGLSIICVLILSITSLFAQDCRRYHHSSRCDVKKSKDYNQYGQARSAVLEYGKTYSYELIFYGGKDYKVQICADDGFYPIHFKLLDAATMSVFYDNMEDDYIESVGFVSDEHTPMIIEIELLAEGLMPEDGKDLRSCVGIQILWRKIPSLGF